MTSPQIVKRLAMIDRNISNDPKCDCCISKRKLGFVAFCCGLALFAMILI